MSGISHLWVRVLSAFFSVVCVLPSFAQTGEVVDQSQIEANAFSAYQTQNFEGALSGYAQLFDALPERALRGLMGEGAAAYRLQDYALAQETFRQAAVIASTDAERAVALFNLGNSYYQTESADFAVEAYQQALLYQPEFAQAEHNLRLAKQLQQQQRQQQAQRQGQNGEGEQGESGQGQGAGERAGKLDVNQSYIGGAGEQNDQGDSTDRVLLPQKQDRTEFAVSADNSHQQPEVTSLAQKIAASQQPQQQIINRQQAERFALKLEAVDLQQQTLLQRMLEREEGFEARQTKPHEIPGVEPW